MTMPLCYVGSEQEILQALQTINTNCGFPNEYAETFDIPKKVYNQELWYMMKPLEDGYTSMDFRLNQLQMLLNVSCMELPLQQVWLEPSNYPPGRQGGE